ncbi:hypothetical protein JY462_11200 [Serratia marcescens]|nr:hypothetical protein [Serratia marcescens]
MSQTNKPAGESKPQPAEQPKPAPVKPDDFSVDRMFVGNSRDDVNRKGK